MYYMDGVLFIKSNYIAIIHLQSQKKIYRDIS